MMKKLIGFPVGLVFAAFLISCGPSKYGARNYGENMLIDKAGDDEYEVLILDPGFDRWFATNSRPPNFYSLEYYESQNRRYVAAWNERASSQASNPSNSPFQSYINYDPTIEYGLEVNYMLFYYFKYIGATYGVRYGFPL